MMSSKTDISNSLSGLVQLSNTSENDRDVRKHTLEGLGNEIHRVYGHDVIDVQGTTDYLLTGEDMPDLESSCCPSCVSGPPGIEEISYTFSTKKSGANLIRIFADEDAKHGIKASILITVNGQTKGCIRLDHPPVTEGTHGDSSKNLTPVAVTDDEDHLTFIFRDTTAGNEFETEVLTADGTAFVVARFGTSAEPVSDTTPQKGKIKRDRFSIHFVDSLLGRSRRILLLVLSMAYMEKLRETVHGLSGDSKTKK